MMQNSLKIISRMAFSAKRTLRITICSLALTIAFGQAIHAQQKKAENSLLWEISGKDLKKPSYLFGTYHFADKGFVDTMKTVNDKLKYTDGVVGELIIDSTTMMKLVPYMMLKGTTLAKLLTPDEYKLVADYLKKETNYDLKTFNMFKPMAVQTIIMQANAPKTFTANNPAIDQYFQDYGKLNHKNLFGLETAEEQAEILFGNSVERQKELLMKSVREGDKEESKKVYNLYITQNLKGLEKFFLNDTSFTPEEMAKLLKNRNANWIEKLPAMMKAQSLFIAVGAGHLIGADGLIKGLQAKGFTVKPLATN